MYPRTLAAVAAILLAQNPLRADVKLPAIFGDHMVLQEGKKLPVWGWADVGEKVTVSIDGHSASATAAADRTWRVDLEPLPLTTKPTTLTVEGKDTLTFQDVVVGDVWLASGQSNMELGIQELLNRENVVDMKQVIADSAKHPLIRIFRSSNTPGIVPKSDLAAGGKWIVVSPDTLPQSGSTAVGYLFALCLQDKVNRPIGVLESSWGGMPIQTFMSRESLQSLPFTADGLKNIQPQVEAWTKLTPDRQTAAKNDYQAKLADWQKNVDGPYNAVVQKFRADDAAAKAAGQPEPPQPPAESQPRPVNPDGEAGWSTTLYNGMINPLIPYALKGALWYQGESNGGNDPSSDQYGALLENMITDWRARWGIGDFPFLVVGIANFGARYSDPVDEGWARVREGEVKATEKLKNVAVSEAFDIGEMHNIHPVDKMDVARRLTAAALHLGYGSKANWSGPTFAGFVGENDHLRIKFNHAADGLMIGVSPHVIPDNPALPTDHLVGFAIAGDDQKWVWADAKIVGDEVVLSSPQMPHPVAARYGWANDPKVNLYNKDGSAQGLPAEPFRTDNWPFVSPPPPPATW